MNTSFMKAHARQSISALLLVSLAVLGGCGGGGGDPVPPATNQVTVSPAQAGYDGAVAAMDAIPTPAGGATVLTAADIVAVQTAFDKVADNLLSL